MSQCLPLSWTKIAVLAALTIAAGVQAAQAMQNKLHEAGSFDCSCSGGNGTCTFVSSTENTDCYKGVGATCTGTCKLTMTPDTPKAAIKSGSRSKANTMKK